MSANEKLIWMTENEKLVWAAVYARYWTGQRNDTPTAVEMAWASVTDMRDAQRAVREGWGDDDEVYLYHQEMLS